MSQRDTMAHLLDTIRSYQSALRWLRRSYERCRATEFRDNALSEEDCDALEALTGRFARASDILIQQVFRAIDKVELEEGGSVLDVLNRAHRRGLIESVEGMRDARELRNEVAHTYAEGDLTRLFQDVVQSTPELFRIGDRIQEFAQRYEQDSSGTTPRVT